MSTTATITHSDFLSVPRTDLDFVESFELSEHSPPAAAALRRDRRYSSNTQKSHLPSVHAHGPSIDLPQAPTDLPALVTITTNATIRPTAKDVRLKLISCFLCVFVAGLNDGSLGALVPYFIEEYKISEGLVGVVYATGFAGWAGGALLMPIVMRYGGLRGTLLLGALCQVLSYLLRFWVPPYPLFATTFFLASLGQAFQDAQANTFLSTIKDSHLWLGFLHAMWSLGTLIAPLIATGIATNKEIGGRWGWAVYYAIPLAVGVCNVVLVLVAFYRGPDIVLHPHADEVAPGAHADEQKKSGLGAHMKDELWEAMKLKVFWLISMFFFFHLAAAMTIGGWIVVYLSDYRGMPLSKAGYVPTGYFAGLFLGRVLLPAPTHNLLGGEHNMLLLYSLILLILQLASWFAPSAIATATVLSIMGFFFGPFFAAGVQVASEVLPRKVKTSALALVFVVAQLGGSVLPAVTGVIASEKGVGVLQPLAVGLIVAMGVSWWAVPKKNRRGVRICGLAL